MRLDTTTALVAAFYSTASYALGLAFLKSATATMPPLHGTRPVQLLRSAAFSRRWLCGALIMLCGTGLLYGTFATLPLRLAVPALLAGALPLLPLATVFFGERPRPRELLALAVIGSAAVAAAAATGDLRPAATSPATVFVYALSLAIPLTVFSVCELTRSGHHARPLSGIAHSVSAGILIGTAELALRSAAAGTPLYLVLFCLYAALGGAQLQISLQRNRLSTTGLIAVTVAKTHLLAAVVVLSAL